MEFATAKVLTLRAASPFEASSGTSTADCGASSADCASFAASASSSRDCTSSFESRHSYSSSLSALGSLVATALFIAYADYDCTHKLNILALNQSNMEATAN